MKIYDKRSLVGICCILAMFCLYGFAAAAEPGPNHAAFRIGYAIVGCIAFVLTFIIGFFMRGKD